MESAAQNPADIMEISGWFNIIGVLVAMDIEKAFFDSLDNSFHIFVMKRLVLEKKLSPGYKFYLNINNHML